jgi:hypothetical protein
MKRILSTMIVLGARPLKRHLLIRHTFFCVNVRERRADVRSAPVAGVLSSISALA